MKEYSDETISAVKKVLGLYRMADKHHPDTPIGRVLDCGCMGPMPECPCMKAERLVKEFMKK